MARAINEVIQRTRATAQDHAVPPTIPLAVPPEAPLRVPLQDGTAAHVGDRIATRRNVPSLRTDHGERVRNRQTWTVTNVRPDGGIVAGDPDRGTIELPAKYVAEHVELGWAVTGYGNQGDTVDIGIAVIEPGTTRNHVDARCHRQPRPC